MWKKIDKEKNPKKIAVDEIHKETGMSEGSAKIYLTILEKLKKGQYFHQGMSANEALYFLSQIYKDYGKSTYEKSLESLDKKIDYVSYILDQHSRIENLFNDLKEENINIDKVREYYENDSNDDKYYNYSQKSNSTRRDILFDLKEAESFLIKEGLWDQNILENLISRSPNAKEKPSRGIIISFLKINDLLDDFINEHWPQGKNSEKVIRCCIEYEQDEKRRPNPSTAKEKPKRDINHQSGEKISNSNLTKASNTSINENSSLHNNSFSNKYESIYQQVETLVDQINKYSIKSIKKKPIFKGSDILGLLREIKKYCTSRESFISFILSLYILYREKTRDINPNYKNKNDYYYIYRFPENFWGKDKITMCSMENIIIIRTEYSHSDEEDDEFMSQKRKKREKSFLDVVEELTNKKYIPETTEDFQELQIEVMKQFADAMEVLLQMVKNEL
jgi:hypothetical protein